MKNIRKMLALAPELKGYMYSLSLVGLFGSLGDLAIPYFIKVLLDQVAKASISRDNGQIVSILSALLAIGIITALMNALSSRYSDIFFYKLSKTLHKKVFSKLTSLSVDYYETHRVGEIALKVHNGVESVAHWTHDIFSDILERLITFSLALVLIWQVNWHVGMVMLIILPFYFLNVLKVIRKSRVYRRRGREYMEKASGQMTEMISNFATIRSFVQEASSLKKFANHIDKYAGERLSIVGFQTRNRFFNLSLYYSSRVVGIGIIVWSALNGQNTLGDIVLVWSYLIMVTNTIAPVSRTIIATSEVETQAERVIGFLEQAPMIVDKPKAITLRSINIIEFRDVTFHYPGKKNKVLDDISFVINAGETIALVGASGVGKSTITKLLMRFYDPTAGTILINGRDMKSYKQDSVRTHMAMVMQDVALFNDTIEENLRFAKPSATDAEIRQAARKAHADVFIKTLPDGYKTLVGERGIKLSGGQKQRVAIARAMLKKPDMIILDEATSALDSESEHHVKTGLKELLKDRTSIIIAHRLSTVVGADQILVMQHGKIVERGRHIELIKRKGVYAKFFRLQLAR